VLAEINWIELFRPDMPFAEIFIRGTVTYLALFAMLRIVLKREAGTVGITDLLVLVLIADAAQNAMAGDYNSITDGLLLVATIVFWCYVLDWLAFHFKSVDRLLRPPSLPLIENGRMLVRNMRKELITEEELLGQLREQGIEDIRAVKKACMETDGNISVLLQTAKQRHGKEDRTV
jgi:uncharacterized membrane protein YcaP (DUF421 family)